MCIYREEWVWQCQSLCRILHSVEIGQYGLSLIITVNKYF